MEDSLIFFWLFLFGLVFFIVGLAPAINYLRLKRIGCKVSGVINKISKGIDTDGKTYYSVSISYVLNGSVFSKKLYNFYTYGMQIGDTVLLYYNPHDPTDITPTTFNFLVLIFSIIGILVWFIDILIFFF